MLGQLNTSVKELDYVIEENSKIIANIVYANGTITLSDGSKKDTLIFGPVSVLPECQRKGYAEKIIKYTLELAKEMGYSSVLITGNPDYYKKYGFFDGIDGLLSFIRSKISKFLWGYGEKMGVLLRNMLLIIVLYATAYFFHSEQILKVGISKYPVISALFYSACTFFSMNVEIGTLSAEWKVITLSEHILGTVLVSLFAAALFRQINRR